MRIGVVTAYYPSPAQPWNGRSSHETLRELATMAEVQVFVPLPQYPRLIRRFVPPAYGTDGDFVLSGPPVTYRQFPVLPVVSRSVNGSSIAWALEKDVRAFRPDILLSYVIYPSGFAALKVAAKLGVPVVQTAIGSDLNRIPGGLIRSRTLKVLTASQTITTVSHDLAKTAVSLGADASHTIAILNGCDTTVFHPGDRAAARQQVGIAPDTEMVLYIGRYDLRKGLIELIDAVASLRNKRPRLRTYLLGGGPDEGALRERIAHHHAGDSILLVPPVRADLVSGWTAASDIVTLPSYMEGCPNVVIEGLASGRPVVATNVGGIPELVDDSCGRLVPPRNAEALAQVLDETLSRNWNADAIASVHSRSWRDVAKDLYGVLEETLQRHHEGASAASHGSVC
ncbi:Glycosyltransferase involved in cell wall bisynthesis [Bryocella elongata]|uniref:Glycosyltransferase involved in cell wall bisynthesis n=1 Tax=Bryocella elongata TaxID=863522 RepID=A0A1H5ZLZ4_9BACT|nr:glycosyltransferase [Bryocella elongata]SEG37449.1 Glycosyltransferase involved in cell wall bisynthesis [Bryocella elongata]